MQKSQRVLGMFIFPAQSCMHNDHYHQQVVHFSCTRRCIWHKKKKKIQEGTDSPQLVIWVCSKLIRCIFPRGIVINGVGEEGCSQMNQKQKIKIYLIYTWGWPTFPANGQIVNNFTLWAIQSLSHILLCLNFCVGRGDPLNMHTNHFLSPQPVPRKQNSNRPGAVVFYPLDLRHNPVYSIVQTMLSTGFGCSTASFFVFVFVLNVQLPHLHLITSASPNCTSCC